MKLFGNLGKKKTGVLPYVLLLVLAIVVLFFISYASFQQNQALGQSTEQVSRTQDIIGEINMLFGSYTDAESTAIKYLISNDSSYLLPLAGFNGKSELSLKRLMKLTADSPEQQKLLNRIPDFSETLFEELRSINPRTAENMAGSQATSDKINAIEEQIDSLESVKIQMIAAQYDLLEQRKRDYKSEVTFTPINILYLALFALGILMFAFSKINSDRKKMAATREFLNSILESTDNIINFLVPVRDDNDTIIDFEIAFVNGQVQEIAGRTATELTNKRISDVYPFAVKKDLIVLLTEVVKTGATKNREIDYEIDGKAIWFDSTFAPMEGGVTVTSRNITKNKEADTVLKQLNKKLEVQNLDLEKTGSFLNNILGSIQYIISYFEAVRDASGKIIDFKIAYTNDQIFEIIGLKGKDIIGKRISEVYPFLFTNGDFETHVKVVTSGEPQETEREYQLPEGDFFFCNEILKLDDGVTIVSQDITLRKSAEKDLETANQRLAIQNTVLNDAESVAGLGSYSYNLSADAMTCSDNCFQLLDITADGNLLEMSQIASMISGEDKARFEQNTAKEIETRQGERNIYRLKGEAASSRSLMIQNHFFEKNGEEYMVGVLRDITKEVSNEVVLQKRNRELERTNAELESFNRVVSHDLQEPLRKIQMFISRFSDIDTQSLSDKGQVYFQKIDESANRMQLLIRNLLSYSRIADETESFQRIDLNYILEKVLDDLSEKIKDTHAIIDIPKLPEIQGTEFQLEQLFNNLLSNSIKYKRHDRSPEIVMTSEILPFDTIDKKLYLSPSAYVFLTLSDNGVGFDADQSEKIFGLFQRLHKKHAYEGTGLGLAICKKIVENHEGHIAAYSEPGKGTRIEIYLPFKKQI